MKKIDLLANFRLIYTELNSKTNLSQITRSMGYTTSSQLHSVLNEKSQLSTKAIIALIENNNVNPSFLFLGEGEVFLSDASHESKLKKENQELTHNHNEALKTIMELTETIKKLEEKNDALIEISSAAIKYHKGQTEDNDMSNEPVD